MARRYTLAVERSGVDSEIGRRAKRAGPGTGLFVRLFPSEGSGRRNPAFGYLFAALAAAISGVAVYVNSLGVATFKDPVLYTAMKDGLVGVILLAPLLVSRGWRGEYMRLDRRTWSWLIALALTGGSVPFALFFSGLKLTTAATGAVVNHFQFVLVAIFAVVFLRERIRPALWAGFVVLLLATLIGTNLGALRWNQGALLIAASTVLFAIDFVIAKHLLSGLSTLMVMTARMTLGTAILIAYLAAIGHLGPIAHLDKQQWQFVMVTGLILLAFTACTFTAIRHASVSAVLAIGAAAPIITTLLQVGAGGKLAVSPAQLAGLAFILLAVVVVVVVGVRQDTQAEAPKAAGATPVRAWPKR